MKKTISGGVFFVLVALAACQPPAPDPGEPPMPPQVEESSGGESDEVE